MKRLALAVTLISAALLSGCIILPGHRHHGGHRGGGYYQGHVHVDVQPGPRR